MQVQIVGSSDDTLGIYGLPGDRYFDLHGGEVDDDIDSCAQNWPPSQAFIFSESNPRKCVVVTGVYTGTWSFALNPEPDDEDRWSWPFGERIETVEHHSQSVTFDVPDDAMVVWNGNGGKGISIERALNRIYAARNIRKD